MRSTPSLRVDFQRSRFALAFVATSHAATATVIAWLPLPAMVRMFSVLLVAALAMRAARADLPAGLVVRIDGSLAILERDGRVVQATLAAGGYTGAVVTTIVATEAASGRNRCWLVLPDMLPAPAYRQLRVRLRYASSADEAGAPSSQARASKSAALSPFG